ncbi:scavenger receptor cysteine-rich domain-containing group B protein [Xenopus laevis]|uniref:Scavenger receptor cysteine-rich domain-containing group B protein n=3 Tax=Xenopus laevis TaxID=8355 RepID=A0A1L8G5W8_XENLA|nr:scavenger receptor cysteine-rich domain-containing group B protein [Xenopus laevis]OCT79220.1 hypothetical protein XELAEV_18030317mg [Xenopus laevis]
MKLLFLISLLFPLISAEHSECSHDAQSSGQILIVDDGHHYGTNVHNLEMVWRFSKAFANPHSDIQLHIPSYDAGKLGENIHNSESLRGIVYFTHDHFLDDYLKKVVWDSFHRTQDLWGNKPRVLVIFVYWTVTDSLISAATHLKRLGIEIFVVKYRKLKDYEVEEIASYPVDTHAFYWQQYKDPNVMFSELAVSICRSIERKKSILSQVRLAGGSGPCEGRVELLYNQTWGWLSDEKWGRLGADVICRQLGCGPSMAAVKGDHFGPGSGHVLGKGMCNGREQDFSQCILGAWKEREENQKSAGVICLASGFGNVRLVNGSALCNGTVEVTLSGSSRRVCIWDFASREAAVTCRQMGCGPLMKIQENLVGAGAEVQMVEKIHCSGGEAELSKCSVSLWREEPCFLGVSAGVVCAQSSPPEMRLVGGSSVCSGKVQVNYGGRWGPVCADEWGTLEEVVVCRQVGCGPAIDTAQGKMPSHPSRSSHHVLESIYCNGHESQLSQCGSVAQTGKNCHVPQAEVLCSQSVISKVALVNGTTACSGRVEVYYKEKWGTVCDKNWDLTDANVVCKELGCGTAIEAPKAAHFSPGDGPIWLEKVFCNGSETRLSECGAVTSRRGVCDHSQDASVICTGPEQP